MEERRKHKRMDLEAKLMVKRLDSDREQVVVIDITDVSRTGVGFSCKGKLDIGAVYECHLTIWTKEVIHVFLQIVRIELGAQGVFHYGAVFVGMSEQDASRISVYESFQEAE
ncbi:MAG: PilZ domain-containing protein [Lachnospiraceae bacterium]|nr:PilZ domain-containing protein [Lachnospiraceae bacterium]